MPAANHLHPILFTFLVILSIIELIKGQHHRDVAIAKVFNVSKNCRIDLCQALYRDQLLSGEADRSLKTLTLMLESSMILAGLPP